MRTIIDRPMTAGIHRVDWDGRDETGIPLPSGIYLIKARAGTFKATRKVTLIK
ncbi:MAG: FlgD immunoglobulin-like domain containing protein [Candidatus Glassbacteria bacterium]